ncbi:MAG: AMP-binding protein [Rhodospirillaceae bacterium]|nr:AMP-binding protein [Rhodospirillaceae bacterium]
MTADTFPKLLDRNARERGPRPAIREKYLGIWQTFSWSETRAEVETIAHGLAASGVQRGDRIAIVGDNRPNLYWSIVAAQALGAIPVPVYQDSVASELAYVLQHAEVSFAVSEDQEQIDKLLEVQETTPALKTLVYCDPRGMREYEQDFIHSLDEIKQAGEKHRAANAGFYDAEVARGQGSDTAIFLYTSGTTGNPKGVVLTYGNLISMAEMSVELERITEDEDTLAYLPMAWVGDCVFSIGQSYVAGFCSNCPESQQTFLTDLKEIGPTYFFAPPRIFENILTSVNVRMQDAGRTKRRLFHYFMAHAKKVGVKILQREKVGAGDRFKYWLGELFVYGPLKNTLGMSRVRRVYTAGEAIGPDIFDFYRSIGLNMKQLYGQTEASVFVTLQPDNEVYADTVGKACPGVEVKVDPDSREVLYRSDGVFKEYYKNEEETRKTKTEDGWVHTGDAGFIDHNGHLKIIDRAKDVGVLNNGSMFAPKYLENKLKFFPFIQEAVTFGGGRDHAAAMISIDIDAVGNWAERNNVSYASYRELAAKPAVYEEIRRNIEQVNADLAEDPELAGAQIARFALLHKELDADDGELTRTRKVRRKFINERYDNLIEALYGSQSEVHCEVETTFEDGRKGVSAADIAIMDAKLTGGAPLAKAG